ncbi:hypothetical protein DESC_180016 [Desulfosarcina cetonica]|nr:hypothetical protein DESC_180016 [Desulfosarcina cetonica]
MGGMRNAGVDRYPSEPAMRESENKWANDIDFRFQATWKSGLPFRRRMTLTTGGVVFSEAAAP